MTELGSRWLLLLVIASMTPLRSVSAMSIQNYDLSIVFTQCLIEGTRACTAADPVSTGVAYHGNFTIDAMALQSEGYQDVGFQSFYLSLGGFTWDSLAPYPQSDYAGSRFYNPQTRSGGFGPWTLLVEQGELTGICCGVYGSGDVPFVDLYSFAPFSTQLNQASVLAIGPGRIPFSAQGSFSFKPVSEPGSAILVGGGLVLLALRGVMRRRRSQPVHARSGNSKRS